MLPAVFLATDVPLLESPEFWVAMAFVAFILILVYYRVPGMLGRALDSRAEAIRKELDEARKLREEAQALLSDYQRRTANAEAEAAEIIERAEIDAKRLAAEAQAALKESLERRTRMAEEKIARAEAQAVSEVRAAAVDRSIAAAEKILREKTAGADGERLVKSAIDALPAKLN